MPLAFTSFLVILKRQRNNVIFFQTYFFSFLCYCIQLLSFFSFLRRELFQKNTYTSPAQKIPFYIFSPLSIRFLLLFFFIPTQRSQFLSTCFLQLRSVRTQTREFLFQFFFLNRSFFADETPMLLTHLLLSHVRVKRKKKQKIKNKQQYSELRRCRRCGVCDVTRIGDDAIRGATNFGLRPQIFFLR